MHLDSKYHADWNHINAVNHIAHKLLFYFIVHRSLKKMVARAARIYIVVFISLLSAPRSSVLTGHFPDTWQLSMEESQIHIKMNCANWIINIQLTIS